MDRLRVDLWNCVNNKDQTGGCGKPSCDCLRKLKICFRCGLHPCACHAFYFGRKCLFGGGGKSQPKPSQLQQGVGDVKGRNGRVPLNIIDLTGDIMMEIAHSITANDDATLKPKRSKSTSKKHTATKRKSVTSSGKRLSKPVHKRSKKQLRPAKKLTAKYPYLQAIHPKKIAKSTCLQKQLSIFRDHAGQVNATKAYACNNDFKNAANEITHLEFACLFKASHATGYAYSNFFETPVTLRVRGGDLDDIYTFPSSEHAYQWAARIFPKNSSEEMLLKWCVGGEFATLDAKRNKKNNVGLRAKMLVGSKNPANLDLAPTPYISTDVEVLFELLWKPILLAKFYQNPQLREGLVATQNKQLVEWSKVFHRKTHGGHKTEYRDPTTEKDTTGMLQEWSKDKWNGTYIQNPVTKTWRAFGFNLMGVYLMRIRALLTDTKIQHPWVYDYGQYAQRS